MSFAEDYFAYQLQTQKPIFCTMAGVREPTELFQHSRRALPDFASFVMVKGNFFIKDEFRVDAPEEKMTEQVIHTIAPGVYQQNTQPMKAGHKFIWFHFRQDDPVKIVSRQDTIKTLAEQSVQNAPQKFIFIPRHFLLDTEFFEFKLLHAKLLNNTKLWGLHDYGSHLMINQLLYFQHMFLIQKLLPDQINTSQKRVHVRKAQMYILHNFKTVQTVADVAAHLSLNASYLSRCFKEYSGETIIHFIQSTKINAARQMIQQGETNIKKTAYEVGYTDLNYFCRIFKKITGKTSRSLKK